MSSTDANFEDIKNRLDQIVDRVSEEDIDLDEALSLYEEAVKLGIAACDASEFEAEEEAPVYDGDVVSRAGESDGSQTAEDESNLPQEHASADGGEATVEESTNVLVQHSGNGEVTVEVDDEVVIIDDSDSLEEEF